jgi:hypothetical protein
MSLQRLVSNLVRLGWADYEIHALLRGADRAVIDREIKRARKWTTSNYLSTGANSPTTSP